MEQMPIVSSGDQDKGLDLPEYSAPPTMAQTEAHRREYEQWVRDYASELYSYAYRLTSRRQIAEDLLQETFMEAWRSVAKRREGSPARAWLFQILRYRFSHWLRDTRHQRQVVGLMENEDDQAADPIRSPLEKLAAQDYIQAGLRTLSPIIRQTFLMVYMEQLTCRETAETLGIPLGTVLSRLDAARRTLRAEMGEKPRPGVPDSADMKKMEF
jgi:RNA polymerase sigma-70 factor, ECF subfamily